MRLLLDSCVWGGVLGELSVEGHDVTRVSDYGPDPGDHAILELALREARVLVTLDKDFGELAILDGLDHCGIIRIVDMPSRMQGAGCLNAISLAESDLASAAIVTVEPRRIRVRPGGQR